MSMLDLIKMKIDDAPHDQASSDAQNPNPPASADKVDQSDGVDQQPQPQEQPPQQKPYGLRRPKHRSCIPAAMAVLPLPEPNGSLAVGVVDIEAAAAPADGGRGLLARLFYPAAPTPRNRRSAPWLPRGVRYSLGYADFLGVHAALALPIISPILSGVSSPLCPAAPLHPPGTATDADVALPDKLPVAIFSHGLGGMRTTYSTLCACLAAKGFVVLAIEHADGSAAVASRNGYKTCIPYARPDKSEIASGETKDQYLKRYRTAQTDIRVNEILEATSLLRRLNAAEFNSKTDNLMHAHSDAFDFATFAGRLDLDNMVAAGHSFGGATVLATLARPDHPFRCGIVLDPWMFPIADNLLDRITAPYITIQSDSFHWADNAKTLVDMFRGAHTHPRSCFGVVSDTGHQDFSDIPLMFPALLCRMGQSGPSDPNIFIHKLDEWITEYLRRILVDTAPAIPAYPAFNTDNAHQLPAGILVGDAAIKHVLEKALKK